MPRNSPHHAVVRQLDESVAEVFAVMLNLACIPAPGGLCANPCFIASVNFSGTIEGSCTVQLTPGTAAELTSNLTGIPTAEIASDLCADTAGEICNMIAGSWKTRQPAEQAACHLSCPKVTLGPFQKACPIFDQAISLFYNFSGHEIALHLAFN